MLVFSIFFMCVSRGPASAAGPASARAPLERASQVSALTPEEAQQRLPVKLRAVVLGDGPARPNLLVLDGSHGLYVRVERPLAAQVAGVERADLVEIEGVTDAGGFAPIVSLRSLRRLGRGAIPDPPRATLDQLRSGRLDAQWVEVAGIVRACERLSSAEPRSRIELATDGGRLDVQMNADLAPAAYVDAAVRLRGVCVNRHNGQRQIVDPVLVVPRDVPLHVDVAPVPEDAVPLCAPSDLFRYRGPGTDGHRVRVRGTVTHHQRGERLFIRGGAVSLRVQTGHAEPLQPGDEVDVLGFPARGEYTPVLEDAIVHRRASGPAPMPMALSAFGQAGTHDADLVRLDAEIVETHPAGDGHVLVLRWSDGIVRAVLPHAGKAALPGHVKPGSRVRVAGIGSIAPDRGRLTGLAKPRSFELLLRSADDVQLLEPPPWWTKDGIIAVLGGVALSLLGLVAAVTWAARRRVREQAVRRAVAEAELSAMMAERNRIAREIHDTLAQGLAAIALHADLILDDAPEGSERLRSHVEILQGLVRRNLADARASIWNMRSQALEESDLAGALTARLRQLGDGTGVEVVTRVEGRARRLPSTTENHVLRIAQEAVVNATRHARATRVDVELAFHETEVRVSIRDDGRGFDPSHARAGRERPPSGSGLGLVGMRERAADLGADLLIQSAPGQGTHVRLTVPIGFTHRLRLMVVDDHPAFRAGLAALLGAQHDMEVVAEAGDAAEALALYRRERPDVVLMDLRLPGAGGVEAIEAIRREFPEARIVVVTTFDRDEDIHRAMRAGARSYLLKGMSRDEIADTIRAVHAGQETLPAEVARRLAERRQRADLTAREVEILHLLTQGRSNKEIAAALFIAEDTVKGHLKTLFVKLGVQDRTEAAISAVRHGIVHLD